MDCDLQRSEAADAAARISCACDRLPFVTVIMPVRNEEAYLAKSLEAVISQDYPRDRMEVIVADGESTDSTREVVRRFRAGPMSMTLINNPGLIASTGMNAAIQVARGDVIVRVDGHCEIAADYVSRCVAHLVNDGADGVGGFIETIGGSYISEAIAAGMSSLVGVGGSAFRTVRDRTLWAETVPFPGYTRDAIVRNGLYDEELVRNQDDEYNFRLRELGGRVLLAADVRSRYYSRSSLRTLWRQYFQYGLWKVRVMQKHPRLMRWRHFAPSILVACLVMAALAALAPGGGMLPLAAFAALYAALLLFGAIWTSSKSDWKYLPVLPLVFAILHVSYGCGFLVGLVRFRRRWGDRVGKVPVWRDALPQSLAETALHNG